MELNFEGRVAVVTGAGNGLGKEHARFLAARGASIVVNDIGGSLGGSGSSHAPAEAVVAEIESAGGTAVADFNTVATAEGGRAIIDTALSAFGRVDIVINNAGILRDRSFVNISAEDVRDVLDVHLVGAFNVTRPAWELMRGQEYGRIVCTSSSAGLFGNFGQTNYSAAKMGLVGLTRSLAIEGEKYGIKANVIAPLATTRMTDGLLDGDPARFDPALVTAVAAWLVHEDCTVSGRVYSCGAGRAARVFVGVGRGFVKEGLTPEDVRDNFDLIDAIGDDFVVPDTAVEEAALT